MLVKAEQLSARVNLGVLFGRRLQVIELKLAGGELNMRINPTDRSRPGMSDSDTDIEALLLDAALIPDQAHIEITDSRTRYEDPERGIRWLLELADGPYGAERCVQTPPRAGGHRCLESPAT